MTNDSPLMSWLSGEDDHHYFLRELKRAEEAGSGKALDSLPILVGNSEAVWAHAQLCTRSSFLSSRSLSRVGLGVPLARVKTPASYTTRDGRTITVLGRLPFSTSVKVTGTHLQASFQPLVVSGTKLEAGLGAQDRRALGLLFDYEAGGFRTEEYLLPLRAARGPALPPLAPGPPIACSVGQTTTIPPRGAAEVKLILDPVAASTAGYQPDVSQAGLLVAHPNPRWAKNKGLRRQNNQVVMLGPGHAFTTSIHNMGAKASRKVLAGEAYGTVALMEPYRPHPSRSKKKKAGKATAGKKKVPTGKPRLDKGPPHPQETPVGPPCPPGTLGETPCTREAPARTTKRDATPLSRGGPEEPLSTQRQSHPRGAEGGLSLSPILTPAYPEVQGSGSPRPTADSTRPPIRMDSFMDFFNNEKVEIPGARYHRPRDPEPADVWADTPPSTWVHRRSTEDAAPHGPRTFPS